jgi:hypothetical protein
MSSSNQTAKQELKFRKCSNIGCDVMIAFQRKTDGSGGWSAVEKDGLGQIVIHNCKGRRVPKSSQQPQTQSTNTSAGSSITKAEILAALENAMNKVKRANIS